MPDEPLDPGAAALIAAADALDRSKGPLKGGFIRRLIWQRDTDIAEWLRKRANT